MDGAESSGVTVQFFSSTGPSRKPEKQENGMEKRREKFGRFVKDDRDFRIDIIEALAGEAYGWETFLPSSDFSSPFLSPGTARKRQRSFIEAIKMRDKYQFKYWQKIFETKLGREWNSGMGKGARAIYVVDFYAVLRTVGPSKTEKNSQFRAGIFQGL